MPRNNPPEKRRARALQRETGRPYTSCLDEARKQITAEQTRAMPETPAMVDVTMTVRVGIEENLAPAIRSALSQQAATHTRRPTP